MAAFPKEFSIQHFHFGAGLPAIRVIPVDVSEPIINIDAAREVEITEIGTMPESIRGYNCIGKSKKVSTRQYDVIGKALANS